MHILVIQTHQGIQLGMAHLIRALGFSVETAKSINEVRDRMIPDVLIVDDASAVNFGLDGLQQLWHELETPPEIILTTGGSMTLDQLLGGNRFKLIRQPLDAEALECDLERIKRSRA